MNREKWRLVFAATDVRHINELVNLHAQAAGVLCCRCDQPEQGDFSGGATRHVTEQREHASERSGEESAPGLIVLAVSTGGASPGLAVRICQEAVAKLDPVWPVYARLLAEWRAVVKTLLADDAARRALLQRLMGEEMETVLRRQGEAAAHAHFNEWLEEARHLPATHNPPLPAPAGTVTHAH